MENASKALLMAGGILIAVLLLTVAVFGYTKIKSFKTTEAEGNLKKQVTAFNAEYESYNRQLLHGIDVISVCNRAISNNIEQEQNDSGYPWFINIKLELVDEFTLQIQKEEYNPTTKKKTETILNNTETLNVIGILNNKGASISTTTTIGGKIDLGKFSNNNRDFITNDRFREYFENSQTNTQIYEDPNNSNIKYIVSSGLTSFKSAIFKCTNVKYNSEGRICEIVFTQKEK